MKPDTTSCLKCAVQELHHALGKLIAYRNDKEWIGRAIEVYEKHKEVAHAEQI